MKVLLDSGLNTGIVFKEGTTNEEICEWVGNNLGFTDLCEEHSCSTSVQEFGDDISIVISGDEDRKEIDIVPFTFIN